MLTVLVPTRNRPVYLRKLIHYYAEAGLPYRMIIGDSSDPEAFKQNEDCVREYGDRIQMEHLFVPSSDGEWKWTEGFARCVNRLLEEVRTPYVVLNADDDFFVPATLRACVGFLEANPDYSAASGGAFLIAVDVDDLPKEIVKGIGPYPQMSIQNDSAFERLRLHTSQNASLEFAVQRTDNMRAHSQRIKDLQLDGHFSEILNNFLTVIRGKIKKLDRLYMVRRAHTGMTSANSQDVFDWVCGPRFSIQTEGLIDCASCLSAKADGLDREAARRKIKEFFWNILAFSLSKGRTKQTNRKYISVKERLKSHIRNRPLLYKPLGKIRSRFFNNAVTLPTFFQLQFRYKSEFMPIYKTIGNVPRA